MNNVVKSQKRKYKVEICCDEKFKKGLEISKKT